MPSSQKPKQYRFIEHGHGDISADVVQDAELGTVLWIQTSVDGCYLRPSRIYELANSLRSAVGGAPVEAPRTERSIWQAIVDALNAAESRGMSVGIDLDGTLTDHNAWSVIWDRDTKQWVLAGYDEETAR
jgi:hypothetical protein